MDGNAILSNAIALPDEILIEIIRACVEPFDIKINRIVFNINQFTAFLRYNRWFQQLCGNTEGLLKAGSPGGCKMDTQDGANFFTAHSSTTIVKGFTKKKRSRLSTGCTNELEYVTGFSKYPNLELVNKMFQTEVRQAVRRNSVERLAFQVKETSFKENAFKIKRATGQRLRSYTRVMN